MSSCKKESNVVLNCSVKKPCKPCTPLYLVKENFLGEFRTELEKKKVLDNLGIVPMDYFLLWVDVNE